MSTARFEVLDISTLAVGEKAEVKWFYCPEGFTPEIKTEAPELLSVSDGHLIAQKEGETFFTVIGRDESVRKKIKIVPAVKNKDVSALKERLLSLSPASMNSGSLADACHKSISKAEEFLEERELLITYGKAEHTMSISIPLLQPDQLEDPPGYKEYPYWTMFSRRIEERIKGLSIAFCLTERKEFAEKIKEYLLGLAGFTRWYEFPHRGSEGNLSNAHFLMGAAIGYDTIRHLLSERDAQLIRNAILSHGIRPLAADFENFDMHNIVCSKQCALLIGSLVIWEEVSQTETYINSAKTYLQIYLNEKSASEETEGLLYTAVAVHHLLSAADAYRKKTGDKSLSSHMYFSRILPDQFFWLMGAGSIPEHSNFSDSFHKLELSALMYFLASRNQNPAAKWYIHNFCRESLEQLHYPVHPIQPLPPEKYYTQPYVKVFESIGLAAMRTGWGKEDSVLSFTSSRSARDHNHFDQNSVILNAGGEWLLTDPGYQDYVPGPGNDFTTGTIGHNSLLVNGKGQSLRGGGAIVKHAAKDGWGRVTGEAAKSYGGRINGFRRTLIFSEKHGIYLIWDQTEKKNKHDRLTYLFHTKSAIRSNGKQIFTGESLPGKSLTIEGDHHSAEILWPKERVMAVHKIYGGAEKYGTYLEAESSEETLLTVIIPRIYGKKCDCSISWLIDKNELKITKEGLSETCHISLPVNAEDALKIRITADSESDKTILL
ncbi:heparinase II/III family protein [Metabacillus sp. KIGAM252]|uniref:Heparinase II/III family protein n=1 Tax=Metabacillus flavus TaxID=2823519 RepID=A0ABS5LGF5_9BACI|nr:heparinase II/III family protein [Metabacillus flavus]MBS2969835.1 heparinase II/III family protein [Metabacillus flavus]